MPIKTYSFDINVDAWIQCVEVEAESPEEAEDKLKSMSLEDLIEAGYVKDFSIDDYDWNGTSEPDEDDYDED